MTRQPITRELIEDLQERVSYLESELAILLNNDQAASIARRYHLNPGCAKLVQALYQAKGRVLSSMRLAEAIGSQDECGKTVPVRVCQARRALGFDAIETVKTFGFCLSPSGLRQIDQIAA